MNASMPQVRAGQVWQDVDKRSYGRHLRVVAIGRTHATVELVTARTWPNRSASLRDDDPRRAHPRRAVGGVPMTAPVRMIAHTSEPVRHPWPDGMFIQGGGRGIVFQGDKPAYRTAFVEAFPRSPDTFLRGEGTTISEAEDSCWAQYQRLTACPAHPVHGPFEARQYTSGAGYCTLCGTWFSECLPEQPEDPDRPPSLLERLFTGDDEALGTVFDAMGNLDSLPAHEG